MFTHADHWISKAVITGICNIQESFIEFQVEFRDPIYIQRDPDLVKFLKGGLNSYIGEIMEYDIERMKGRFDNPAYDKKNSVNPIVIDENDESGEFQYLYTPEIAVAFHHLLVSSLLSYVFRLRIVRKAVKALPVLNSEPKCPIPVVEAFIQLLLSAQLLFLVSHSRLFKKHSELFFTDLKIPTDPQAGLYNQEFTRYTLWHSHLLNDKVLIKALDALSPQAHSESVQASAIQASPTEELDAGDTDEVLDNVPDRDGKVGVIYRRWILGLVDHFASIRVLERACGKLPEKAKINFSLLGLNRPSLLCDSWTSMVDNIQAICQDSSLFSMVSTGKRSLPSDLAKKAIAIIETKIKEYKAPSQSVHKTSKRLETMVYSLFKNLLSNPPKIPKFTGCGHCEAILMAIIYRIIKKDDLDFSLKARSP